MGMLSVSLLDEHRDVGDAAVLYLTAGCSGGGVVDELGGCNVALVPLRRQLEEEGGEPHDVCRPTGAGRIGVDEGNRDHARPIPRVLRVTDAIALVDVRCPA